MPQGITLLDMENLLRGLANRCVFCGAASANHFFDLRKGDTELGCVKCGGCGACGPLVDATGLTEVDDSWFPYAVAAWNRRA